MSWLDENYTEVQNEQFEYDCYYRLKYHPELHNRHGEPYSESELEYICKFAADGSALLSLAVGRPMTSVAAKITALKSSGKFFYYKNLNKHW